jgi:hypothetical protein
VAQTIRSPALTSRSLRAAACWPSTTITHPCAACRRRPIGYSLHCVRWFVVE